MAVVIRLQRIGKPKQPYYRVVAIDKRRPAQGKPLEILGAYNPREVKTKDKIQVNQERLDHWLKVGAKASETVLTLLNAAKNPEHAGRVKKKKAKKAEGQAAAPAPAA